MNSLRYFLYIFFIPQTLLFSANHSIIESNTISSILDHINEKTLIVLDIDNTIMAPVQFLGSDQWAWSRVKALIAQGIAEEAAYKQTSNEWIQAHSITKVKLVEESAAEFIHSLQMQNHPVIALTTRRPHYADLTLRELNELDINFAHTAIQPNPSEFMKDNVLFKEGILFISLDNRKGEILKEYLQKTAFHPSKIVFVDDKLSHVKDVGEACRQLDLDFVGIRYGAADEQVASFDPLIAEIQLFFMNHILSNEEAAMCKQH